MSPWVIVTAYFARSCWISTRSSVLVDIDLAAFHYKTYVLCNANVQQRITWHGDDVGGDDGGRPQHRGGRHAPLDERDQLVGVAAVWDRRRVGADRDLDARLV